MLLSDDGEGVARARFLATQAKDPAPHFEHSVVGFNYRMSNLLAAVGRGQLRVLDQRVQRKREINARYRRGLADLPGIAFMPEADYGRANCWLTCITVDPLSFGASREQIRLRLEAFNIESRPVWKPMHLQPVFAGKHRFVGPRVADRLFEDGLCLPCGTAMTDDQQDQVVELIRSTPRAGGDSA
jgi:dTDP-4-amino-4,6-dideoxygalactose transaminase